MPPSNLDTMSPEQLRLLVASLQRDLQAAETREQEAEARRHEAEARQHEAEAQQREAEKRQRETEKLRQQAELIVSAYQKALEENLPAVKAALTEFGKDVGPYGDFFGQSIYQQVQQLCTDLIESTRNAITYRQELYGHGPDLPKTKRPPQPQDAPSPEDLKESFKGVKNTLSGIGREIAALGKAAVLLPENNPERKALQRAAAAINKSKKAAGKPRSSGRRPKPRGRRPKKVTVDGIDGMPCTGHDPKTGKPCNGTMRPIGAIISELVSRNDEALEQLRLLQTSNAIFYCDKCGEIYIPQQEGLDNPVVPNREIGCSVITGCALDLCSGTPISRSTDELQKDCRLGSDTIQRNFTDAAHIYFVPLAKTILEALKKRETIVADESTLDVLELQGRGHQSKEPKTTEPTSGNYFLALTTPSQEDMALVYFEYMGSRSRKRISETLDGSFQCSGLTADGFAAYDAIIKAGFGRGKAAVRQSCLTHLRRTLCKALSVNSMTKFSEGLTDEQLIEHHRQALLEGRPQQMLMTAIEILNGVYAVEQTYRRKEGESEASWHARLGEARRKYSKPLMDALDKIMKKLSEGRIEKNRNGRTWKKTKSLDPVATACVYYANGRDNFRTFLEHPQIPPSSDIVEGRIRPVTVLRKNIYFMQTQRGVEGVMAAYTLVQTAKLNGVNVRKWLNAYFSNAYWHCVKKAWRYAMQEGKDPSRRINEFNVEPLETVRAKALENPDDEKAQMRYRYNMHYLMSDYDCAGWLKTLLDKERFGAD